MQSFRIQGPSGTVTPIQARRSPAMRGGVEIQVMHILVPPEIFAPQEDGSIVPIILEIQDVRGGLRLWSFPERTMRQVYEDFRPYLDARVSR
jgi:hypothetical protein